MILIGNLCSYQFWQHVFKVNRFSRLYVQKICLTNILMCDSGICLSMQDKHRVEHLKQILKFNELNAASPMLPEIEEEWCSVHNLVQTSLHQVSEMCMYLIIIKFVVFARSSVWTCSSIF